MISKYIYRFIIVKNKNSYTNKACKINTGNNPLLFFGLSGISVVFPVIRVFPVSLGTHEKSILELRVYPLLYIDSSNFYKQYIVKYFGSS